MPSSPFVMSIILFWFLLFTPIVVAFNFSPGNPTECDSLPISWSGGVAPFFLHIIPLFGTPQNISIPAAAFNNGKGSFSVQALQVPQGHRIILSMSDATGFATGGTTDILTVGASKGGQCNSTDPGVDFSFELNDRLIQCQPYTFSGYTGAFPPVQIYGIIPSGTSFILSVPTGASQFSWTANVQQGTSLIFMMADSLGRQGGASNVLVVGNSDNQSCLSGSSPSSTSASPTTTQNQPSNKPTKSSTSSSGAPSSTSSDGASSGGTSTGAIAGTVIGALLFIAAIVTLGMFFLKKRKEAKLVTPNTGFPPYSGGHTNNGFSLSSTANATYGAPAPVTPSPYTPHSSQNYNPYIEPSYGQTYQPSQYAPSTYTPSAPTHMHNHTLSGGAPGAYDAYQGTMLPYDANPFLDNPHQAQQYPPANYAYQSTYQLPSASAYTLPHLADPFNPPVTDREHALPPLPPPSASEDPYAAQELASTSDSKTSSQQRKAAMAGVTSFGASQILVHTDAEDILPPPNEQGLVELPPRYTERRGGGGLAVVNVSPPSPSSSPSPHPSHHQQLPPSST